MQRPIKVDSPFATPYDVARILGVSKSRTEEIRKCVKRMLHRDAATGEITVVRAKRKAISAFGFAPRATLEIPFSGRRLERILRLISESKYSIHDLSRVQ